MNTKFKLIVLAAVVVFAMSGYEQPTDSDTTEHEHQWGSWAVTTAATCTAAGVETRICALDGTAETRAIAALGHNWGEWGGGTATCTEAGTATRVCSRDSSHIETNNNEALGHNYEWEPTTVSSFIEEYEETGTCTHDNDHTDTHTVDPLPITSTDDWEAALEELGEKTGGEYTLTIAGDFDVAGTDGDNPTFGTTADGSILTVTLKGNGTVSLDDYDHLLNVGANQTLIIDSEDLVLQGKANTYVALVKILQDAELELKAGTISGNAGSGVSVGEEGTFTMTGGVISGNTAGSGGGVSLISTGSVAGTFTMTGGVISGNTASSGGGVMINGGTVIMTGGVISGNTATESGGGLYVWTPFGIATIFRIVTGTIYGSNESTLSNTADDGAALYVTDYGTSGIVEYGTFTNDVWSGTALTATDDTIEVVNGELQQ